MPNRKTHQILTVICSTVALPSGIFLSAPEWLALEAGILVTLMPEFTPDLDISTRKFGGLGKLLGLKAYAELIPHRYGLGKTHWTRLRIWNIFFFSHIPGIGTLPRTLILLIPVILTLLIFNMNPVPLIPTLLYLWLGMSLSYTWHTIADLVTTDFKQLKREYWYGRKTQGMARKTPRYRRY